MGSTTSSTRRAGAASTVQRLRVDLKTARGSHEGTHVFEISGYSLIRERLGERGSVSSAEFAVGGHDWQIQFHRELLKDHAAVLLLLRSKNGDAKVRATFRLSLVDVTGRSPPHTMAKIHEFDPGGKSFSTGFCRFMEWSELEASPYLRDDRLTIECVVSILKDARPFVDDMKQFAGAEVPPSDIGAHLGRLLQGKEGADVVLEVQGEAFPAHKLVLAMRSPVFKAELYGAMRGEKDTGRITVTDMQPAVFEALLHFIYTDSLPAMPPVHENSNSVEVATHRFRNAGLKLICESILCKNIDAKTVVTTLALADQHHCNRLNDACIQFIASLDATELDDVIASQEYVELKATSPLVLVEMLEKASRLGKSKSSVHIGSLVQTVRYIKM
ncbi:hypothetical protein VPH35_039812 [Triticum aestivum]